MRRIKDLLKEMPNIIMDDEKRTKIQYLGVYGLLGFVSLFMTILNIFTKKGALTFATALFAVICAVNFLFEMKGGIFSKIAAVIFQIEILFLFGFFIVSGNPEGFSCIWIAMLPSCGMMLFRAKNGSILCAIQFAILAFFLWTDLGKSFLRYNYTESFKMRFPVLFIAFYIIALILETIRESAFSKYQYMCDHDTLTGALNRRGFTDQIEIAIKSKKSPKAGFIIADLDFFKNVNDTYGHFAGDVVLEKTAKCLEKSSGLHVCRWGGEEFAIFDPEAVIDQEILDIMISDFSDEDIVYEGVHIPITISIGGVVANTEKYTMNDIARFADECLFQAKDMGRNCAVFKEII